MTDILSKFDKVYYGIGLFSQVPIVDSDRESYDALLAVKKMMGRGNLKDEEKGRVYLSYDSPPGEKEEFFVSLDEKRGFRVVLDGGYSPEKRDSLFEEIISILNDKLFLNPETLKYIDKKIDIIHKTPKNPEEAFSKTAQGSSLYKILEGNKIFKFRP